MSIVINSIIICIMLFNYICTLQRALGITYTSQVFWCKIQLLQCGLCASSPPTLALSAPSPTIPLSCSSWRHPPGIKARSHWLPLKNWLYGLFLPVLSLSYWVIPARLLPSIFVCWQPHTWISLVCHVVAWVKAELPKGALCCDYGYTDDLQERRWASLIAPKSP